MQTELQTDITDPEAFRLCCLQFPDTLAEWATEGRWKPYPHLEYIGGILGRAFQKPDARVIINMPPGHCKSTLGSVWFPIWFLENDPHRKLIVGGHGSDFAAQWGRAVRNEFEQNPNLRTTLSEDSKAKSRWNTPQGGGMVTAGVGRGVMGWRANAFVIDDPYPDWPSAYSATWRRTLEDWYNGTVTTRLEPGAGVVVIHHRMAVDDLTAMLTEREPGRWTVLRLPALADQSPDPLGRPLGAALCPERYSAERLVQLRDKETVGEVWDAMYQQGPRLVGTGAIYDHFGAWNLDGSIVARDDLPIGLALDFNINPGMHGEAFQYTPRFDEFRFLREFHGPRMTLIELVKAFVAWFPFRDRRVDLYGDASGSAEQESDGKSDWVIAAKALTDNGFVVRVRVPSKNPRVVDRVNSLNDALKSTDGAVHALIHPACVRLVEDLRKQRRDDNGHPDESDTMLGHSGAATGYAIDFLRPAGGRIKIPTGGRVVFSGGM